MAKLPYVASGWSPEIDRIYAEFEALGRPILNLYRELANQPPALAAFLQMSRYVRDRSSLDAGLRELVILATANVLEQPYETAHHTTAARAAGVSTDKIAAVGLGGSLDDLSEPERAAVEFAREASVSRSMSAETFSRLSSLFSAEEIVDLVVTVAWYHLCAVILGTLGIELEEGSAS